MRSKVLRHCRGKGRKQCFSATTSGGVHESRSFHVALALSLGTGLCSRPATLEIFKKLRVGIYHHHVVATLEARPVGFETAIKLEELGILAKCLRINLR